MKTRKTYRLFTLFLALVMLMSLAVPVFAAENDTPPAKEIRMLWLDWDENGRCYASDELLERANRGEGDSGMRFAPGNEGYAIFYIWNNQTQKQEKFVVPKAGKGVTVEKLASDEITRGAKQSRYYVRVTLNSWEGADLTADSLTFHVDGGMDWCAFFTSQTFSQESYVLNNGVNEKGVTDCTVYFGNSYAGTDEADDNDKVVSVEKVEDGNENLYTLEKVSDDCWKIVYKDVLAVWGDIWVNLKLEVRQPDGETREDYRGTRIYRETAPELRFVLIDGEWDEKMERDVFFYNPERRDVNSSLELVPGDPQYGILGYGGDWDENGFNFNGFTPVSVKDVKLPEGVTANTDVPAKKGAKWSQYYVELSSEAKDQDFTLTYKEYELTVSCRLPDIGVYTAPEATRESWAGPWGFPFNAVLDNEYYIISTASDAVHGRHVTDLALSAEWNKEDDEVANDGAELACISDGVYKLTLKDSALERTYFHLELDSTWTDIAGNTWTDTNRFVGNFDLRVAIMAGETALTDGTVGYYDMEPIPAADAKGKVTNSVAMTAGEDKVLYLYRSTYSYSRGPVVGYMPYRGYFYSSSEDLTLTADDKDYSKFTLSCAKPGTYEVYMGEELYDWENLKLFHADGKEYTKAEMDKLDILLDIESGRLMVCSEWDKETYQPLSDFVPFEEMFPGETYELKSLGFEEWDSYTRLTVTVEDAAVELPFTDVKEENWFYDDVAYVVAHSLMNGIGDDKFDPNGDVSRAMVPTVLYRVEGQPEAPAGAFTDVAAGQWYTDAINWAAANSIVNGVGGGAFGITEKITHEQLATMLYRYAEYKGCDMSVSNDLSAYTDGDKVSNWALKQMQWAVAAGITGDKGTSLDPQGVATRAELAAFLTRLYRDVL